MGRGVYLLNRAARAPRCTAIRGMPTSAGGGAARRQPWKASSCRRAPSPVDTSALEAHLSGSAGKIRLTSQRTCRPVAAPARSSTGVRVRAPSMFSDLAVPAMTHTAASRVDRMDGVAGQATDGSVVRWLSSGGTGQRQRIGRTVTPVGVGESNEDAGMSPATVELNVFRPSLVRTAAR